MDKSGEIKFIPTSELPIRMYPLKDNKVKESTLTLQNLMAEILLKGSQRKVNEEQAKAIPAISRTK